MENKFEYIIKLDIGGISENGGIYAPETDDNEIHEDRRVFIKPGDTTPEEPIPD